MTLFCLLLNTPPPHSPGRLVTGARARRRSKIARLIAASGLDLARTWRLIFCFCRARTWLILLLSRRFSFQPSPGVLCLVLGFLLGETDGTAGSCSCVHVYILDSGGGERALLGDSAVPTVDMPAVHIGDLKLKQRHIALLCFVFVLLGLGPSHMIAGGPCVCRRLALGRRQLLRS